jgi:hypothetical protein
MAVDQRVGAEFAQVLNQDVDEGVIIVDDQDALRH